MECDPKTNSSVEDTSEIAIPIVGVDISKSWAEQPVLPLLEHSPAHALTDTVNRSPSSNSICSSISSQYNSL